MMSSLKPTLARIKVKFPENIWIAQMFSNFQDVRMEIEHFLPYDLENYIGNAMIEIFHYKTEKIIEMVENHPSVHDFSLLEKEDNRIRINVKTKDPILLYSIIKCGVLVKFPIKVRDGYAYWRLISSRSQLDSFLSLLEKKGVNFELLRVGNSPYEIEDGNDSKLSYEELEVLNIAIERGFFEVPRDISLQELADELGKSKSALSVMLRKIIKKKVMLEV